MKGHTTTLVLSVALVVVAGLFSSTIFGLTGTKSDTQSDAKATGLIFGHVTTTLTDADGNIKAYRQSDNLIVNNGENCVSKMLFGAAGGATVGSAGTAGVASCNGALTTGFRYIAIGNNSASMAVHSTNLNLGREYNATASSNVPSLAPKFSTVTWTNSTGGGNDNTSSATALLSTTFTNTQGNTKTVNESGLFNGTAGSPRGMFARQTFSDVTMNNGDSLTVQWTINIGGTGSFTAPP